MTQRFIVCCCILLCLYTSQGTAQIPTSYNIEEHQDNQTPQLSSTEQYKNHIPVISKEDTNTHSHKANSYRSTDILPLFAKQLGLKEEETPPPFAIMLLGNYLQTSISTWNFSGNIRIHIRNRPINIPIGIGSRIPAQITEVKQRFFTGGIRFVVNILPFWNIYGIFAQSTGTTTSGIQIGTSSPVNFTMAFDASSFGFGTSLAIGGKLLFTAADVNYVITTVESIKNMIYTINASMRIGFYKHLGLQTFAMWIGGNYMENIGGSNKLGAIISVERLSDIVDLGNLGNLLGKLPANIAWSVDQKPKNVFSATIGMRYSPNRNFDIVTEVSFIDRVNVMVSAAYNF